MIPKNVAMNLDIVKKDSDQEGQGQKHFFGKQYNPTTGTSAAMTATTATATAGSHCQLHNILSSKGTVDQLVVNINVHANYQSPPHLDFDYVME